MSKSLVTLASGAVGLLVGAAAMALWCSGALHLPPPPLGKDLSHADRMDRTALARALLVRNAPLFVGDSRSQAPVRYGVTF